MGYHAKKVFSGNRVMETRDKQCFISFLR